MPPLTPSTSRTLAWCAAAATPVLCVVYLVGHRSPVSHAAVCILLASAVLGTWFGGRAHLNLPILRRTLVGCASCFAVANGLVLLAPGLLAGSAAATAFVALTALAGFACIITFAAVMVRQVAPHVGPVLWLDAALLAIGVVVVGWTFLIPQALDDPDRLTSAVPLVVFLGIDAAVVGLALQLADRPVARVPAFWFMLIGFGGNVVGDVVAGVTVAGLADGPRPAVDVWHLAAFGLLCAMALHPSLEQLRTPAPDHAVRTNPARLTISYLALVVPTVALLEFRVGGGLERQLRIGLYLLLTSAVFARMVWTALNLSGLQRTTRHRADHDELTGLLNRAATFHVLEDRLAHEPRPTHLLFVDIDHFKQVNDTWGHGAGDVVLREASQRLLAAAGPGAVVGRVGGDEFVVGCHEDPLDVATRVRGAFADAFSRPDGDPIAVTCSIGVASSEAGASLESLVADADVAMYSAKKAERNSIRRFSPAEREIADEAAHLRQLLDGALDRGELAVHLQPLVEVDGTVAGYEALLRWESPVRGSVRPDVFVPVADAAGLMERIGAWVLAEACAHLVPLRARHGADLYVTVNLTARQLADAGLQGAVTAALSSAGLPATALWLELTESSMVSDTVATRENVAALRGLGVVFALDDFGTGFASLAHLHDIDCQVVKVDRSFVARLGVDASSDAIIRAIIAMAHSLDLRVVAEGVETAEQADRLRVLGVDFLQGYYFGRPAPWAYQVLAPHQVA